MSKFPLLDEMRAARVRREAPVIAPYQAEIVWAAEMVSSLRRRLRAVEEAIGRDIGSHMLEAIGHDIAGKLTRLVYEASARATGPHDPVTITLPPNVIRFADPKSVESEVVRRYQRDTLPRLSVRIDETPMDHVTLIDIRVPELGVRHAIQR